MKAICLKTLGLALLLATSFACDKDDGDDAPLPTQPGAPIPQEQPATGTTTNNGTVTDAAPSSNGTGSTTGTGTTGTDTGTSTGTGTTTGTGTDTGTTTGSNTSGNTSGTGLTEGQCQSAWTAYVKQHPVGLSLTYETTVVSKYVGGVLPDSTTKTNMEQLVKESSDAKVVTKTTVSVPGLPASSSDAELTKVQFIETCQSGNVLETVDVQGSFELLEQKKVSVAVKAGTFDADYIKGKYTINVAGSDVVTNSETWLTADDLKALLKNVTSSESTFGPMTVQTSTTMELVKIAGRR